MPEDDGTLPPDDPGLPDDPGQDDEEDEEDRCPAVADIYRSRTEDLGDVTQRP